MRYITAMKLLDLGISTIPLAVIRLASLGSDVVGLVGSQFSNPRGKLR